MDNFYNRIITVANMGVVTAADFVPFIGQTEFLTLERSDMSVHWQRTNPDKFNCGGVVTKFTVRRVFADSNVVEIMADIGEPFHAGTLMHLNADELAIRMEDA